MGSIVYDFGLVVVVMFILLGLDDLIIDIAHLVLRRGREEASIPFDRLDEQPPRLLGVVIAAWDEAAVIEQVVSNMIESYHYPRSMYHIFIGTYPNDAATTAKVRELERRYANVHMVINTQDGPTNKADNINQILRYVKKLEAEREWEFASLTVHDSEDIVHPYELKMTNYLIDQHDAIQMPVFPLQEEPRLGNFFRGLTRSTYTAEFAKNHYRTLSMRAGLGGVVPSAGTGFVLTRRVLEYFGDDLFPTGSLTEDYKLSLILAEHGFRVHYALGRVHRLDAGRKVVTDFVATRSIFPGTFKAAVRQKTRWVYGITMQSVGLKDIFIRDHEAGIIERISVLKDLKAKLDNIMVLPGYIVFGYFIASFIWDIPAMYPFGSLSFWLTVVLTCMMVERQYFRAVALGAVYGWRYVISCCLLPPLLPLSLVWGNIINFCSTVRAWKQHIFGVSKKKAGNKKKGRQHKWAKTDHEFPDSSVLQRFRRDLPDTLLKRNLVEAGQLADAMRRAEHARMPFQNLLLYEGAATEEDLAKAIASTEHTIYLGDLSRFCFPNHAWHFEEEELREHGVYPLLMLEEGIVFAVAMDTLAPALEHLHAEHNAAQYVLSTRSAIDRAITDLYAGNYSQPTKLLSLVRSGRISWEQGVIAVAFQPYYDDIGQYMGISAPRVDISEYVDEGAAELFAAK